MLCILHWENMKLFDWDCVRGMHCRRMSWSTSTKLHPPDRDVNALICNSSQSNCRHQWDPCAYSTSPPPIELSGDLLEGPLLLLNQVAESTPQIQSALDATMINCMGPCFECHYWHDPLFYPVQVSPTQIWNHREVIWSCQKFLKLMFEPCRRILRLL